MVTTPVLQLGRTENIWFFFGVKSEATATQKRPQWALEQPRVFWGVARAARGSQDKLLTLETLLAAGAPPWWRWSHVTSRRKSKQPHHMCLHLRNVLEEYAVSSPVYYTGSYRSWFLTPLLTDFSNQTEWKSFHIWLKNQLYRKHVSVPADDQVWRAVWVAQP